MQVTLFSLQNNTNITVQVTVLDVNDNSPVFNSTNYKLTVVNNSKDELLETVSSSLFLLLWLLLGILDVYSFGVKHLLIIPVHKTINNEISAR